MYDNGIYVEADDELQSRLDTKFRGINRAAFIEEVLNYIRRATKYEFEDKWFALDNCMFNPVTGEVQEPSFDIVTRIKLNVTYDPEAKCPRWLWFIDECKTDNKLLQEIAGFGLTPGYEIQKACMLLGTGGQGKSVFLKVLNHIYGEANTSSVPLQDRLPLGSIFAALEKV
jgi:phage/plasmid-associated DNA primase